MVAASGEALPLPVARRFADVLPGAVLDNLYGPTEAAVEIVFVNVNPQSTLLLGQARGRATELTREELLLEEMV